MEVVERLPDRLFQCIVDPAARLQTLQLVTSCPLRRGAKGSTGLSDDADMVAAIGQELTFAACSFSVFHRLRKQGFRSCDDGRLSLYSRQKSPKNSSSAQRKPACAINGFRTGRTLRIMSSRQLRTKLFAAVGPSSSSRGAECVYTEK